MGPLRELKAMKKAKTAAPVVPMKVAPPMKVVLQMKVATSKKVPKKGGCKALAGKKICFSGCKNGERFLVVASAGATFTNNLNKQCDIMVAGPGAGSKLAKAAALGIEVWDYAKFRETADKDPFVRHQLEECRRQHYEAGLTPPY